MTTPRPQKNGGGNAGPDRPSTSPDPGNGYSGADGELRGDSRKLRVIADRYDNAGESLGQFHLAQHPVLTHKPIKGSEADALKDQGYRIIWSGLNKVNTEFFTVLEELRKAVGTIGIGLRGLAKAQEVTEENNIKISQGITGEVPPVA
ncbi:hypothetical protein [Saccharothrix sp. Mg75]|uniref:hypothetical protein n=1 Tax=Saccharothrix sp. Mg75 TaxID=3445357 RepID=UPI003EED9668